MNGKTNSKTKKLILFALLAGGILSGGIGYWLLKGIGQKNEATFLSLKRARLAVLDQQAAVHFKNAREHVKNAVNTLTAPGNLLKICGKFCYDKFKGTNELQSFLSSHISPVTEECKKAAMIYGVDFESTQFASAMQEAAKGHINISLFSLGGLGLEAIMFRHTISSIAKVLASLSARAVATLSTGKIMALADGPLPIGDILAILMAAGGTILSVTDLIECYIQLPNTMTAALESSIESCRISCRKVFMQ